MIEDDRSSKAKSNVILVMLISLGYGKARTKEKLSLRCVQAITDTRTIGLNETNSCKE